jgi:hypothetical protein
MAAGRKIKMTVSTLPRLDTRRHFERAALTRLQHSHELALQAHIVHALVVIGRHSAKEYRQGRSVTAHADIRHGLARLIRPSLVSTARAFADRVTHHLKCSHAFERKAAFDDLDNAIRDFLDDSPDGFPSGC